MISAAIPPTEPRATQALPHSREFLPQIALTNLPAAAAAVVLDYSTSTVAAASASDIAFAAADAAALIPPALHAFGHLSIVP